MYWRLAEAVVAAAVRPAALLAARAIPVGFGPLAGFRGIGALDARLSAGPLRVFETGAFFFAASAMTFPLLEVTSERSLHVIAVTGGRGERSGPDRAGPAES